MILKINSVPEMMMITMWPSSFVSMFVPKRPENGDLKGYVPNTEGFVAALFTTAQSGTTQVSTTRGMDKVDMVCTQVGG